MHDSNPTSVAIETVEWDPAVYPRSKWNTATIERYADALEAGETFPPIVLEMGTDVLLDGKHRLEAHKKAGRAEIDAEWHVVPDGMSTKYYAATLSARHGDRMANTDLKALAEEDFEDNPNQSARSWSKGLGITERTVQRWVKHITDRAERSRWASAAHLLHLGWTQGEVGAALDVDQATVSRDMQERQLSDLHIPTDWNGRWLDQESDRLNIPIRLLWAAALDGLGDADRFAALDVKVQPYDVWQFAGCHDLMGDRHPGRIPGEMLCHVLYFFTEPGDLVVDPMAGSGTTLDACLLMGRKARGYDIDARHERVDIEHHDLSTGWPDTVGKASLVFWDPPYFDKMDHGTIGDDGYIEGSISGLDPDEYMSWFADRFAELHKQVRPGTRFAFLMSDWDPENAKRHADHPGMFMWDYADRLRDTGWTLRRQIQAPLSTQQVHPDIVNKFRASRRLARLGRSLLVAEA